MKGSSKCQCGCGLDWTTTYKHFADSFDREMVARAGRESVLTSGARCKNHNAAVGGKANSTHLKSCAGDFAFSDSHELYIILDILFNTLHVKRIGINFDKQFVHWDIAQDEPYPQQVVWKY